MNNFVGFADKTRNKLYDYIAAEDENLPLSILK
jgi:hypothetical protein